MYFFSTRLGSPLLFSSGPAVIIRHVTVIFFDVFIEFCVERAVRSEKCSFCVRPGEFACRVMSTLPIENELWNFVSQFSVAFQLECVLFRNYKMVTFLYFCSL